MKAQNKIYRNSLMLSLLLVITIVSLSFVSASVNLTEGNVTIWFPESALGSSTDGDVTIAASGSIPINISIGNGTYFKDQNWSTAEIFFISAGATANTTLVRLNTSGQGAPTAWTGCQNFTENITCIIDTAQLEDGADYTMTIALFNGTTFSNTVLSRLNITRTVRIDNFVPVAPTNQLPTTDDDGLVNFSVSVNATQTTACTLYFVTTAGPNPGQASYAMVHDSSTQSPLQGSCSIEVRASEGRYTWFTEVSDGTNRTNSTTTQQTVVEIQSGGSQGSSIYVNADRVPGGLSIAGDLGTDGNNKTILVIIGIIVSIVIVFVIFKKK